MPDSWLSRESGGVNADVVAFHCFVPCLHQQQSFSGSFLVKGFVSLRGSHDMTHRAIDVHAPAVWAHGCCRATMRTKRSTSHCTCLSLYRVLIHGVRARVARTRARLLCSRYTAGVRVTCDELCACMLTMLTFQPPAGVLLHACFLFPPLSYS
jgi:hypothetical protein